MIKKIINSKIAKFSTVCLGNLINTFCADDEVELNEDSYIIVNGFSISLDGFMLKKNTNEIKTEKDLIKYFLEQFSDLEFQNINNDEDDDNGKILEEVFELKNNFKNGKLYIASINENLDKSCYIKELLDYVFKEKKLQLELNIQFKVVINDNFCYKLNENLQKKLDNVNNEMKPYFNVKQIKQLMEEKGFTKDEFNILNEESKEYKDDDIIYGTNVFVNYKDEIDNYLEHKTAVIKFIPGEGFDLEENLKNYDIDFVKDNINEDTTIYDFIFNKWKELSSNCCDVEYYDCNNENYETVDENLTFEDGDIIKITINEEIDGFTKKKAPEKHNIAVNFEIKDPSKYAFKKEINNINNLEVEEGKDYDYLIGEIKNYLSVENLNGFKIYKNTKDSSNEFTTGDLEDNTTYIVVFDENATDFVKEKEKNKFYININFDVTDGNNFKLKQDINNINSLEIDKGKNYNDLLNLIKNKLGNKELKEGFKIYKNDKNTEFTTGGIVEDNTTYIVVFANDDTNFVDKKTKTQKPPQKTPQKTQPNPDDNNKSTTTEQTKEENKKSGYSGKTKEENSKNKGCC